MSHTNMILNQNNNFMKIENFSVLLSWENEVLLSAMVFVRLPNKIHLSDEIPN